MASIGVVRLINELASRTGGRPDSVKAMTGLLVYVGISRCRLCG